MRIQHNIMAMNAYRNYNNNTSALSKNLEKLSSGYKINRAGDDAAGLAISEKMRAQISGLQAAQKNVKDGISLVKTGEGAMQEIQDMLNRMDYLATQSANGTYDNEVDRANLQKEVNALKTEINRIADSSNFNGINLLDGSMESKNAVTGVSNVTVTDIEDGQLAKEPQVGVFSVDFSRVELRNTSTTAAGSATIKLGNSTAAGYNITLAASSTKGGADLAQEILDQIKAAGTDFTDEDGNKYDVSIDGGKLTFTQQDTPANGLNKMKAFVANVTLTGAGVTSNQGDELNVTVEQEPISANQSRVYAKAQMQLDVTNVKDGATLKIGDTTYVFAVGENSAYKNYANVVDLTDMSKTDNDLYKVAAGRLTNVAKDNKNFIVGSDIASAKITFTEKEGGVDYSVNNLAGSDGKSDGKYDTTAGTGKATAADWKGLIQTGTINAAKSSTGLTLQIGDTADSYNQMRVSIGDMHTSAMGVAGVDISTQEGAQAAISTIKNAINYVSSVRGDLGAVQNRLEHTQNNLSVMAENIQDAESTIRDTDVAEEMMSYVKNNILVQSAQAMLAQANQVPQGVLQLLG